VKGGPRVIDLFAKAALEILPASASLLEDVSIVLKLRRQQPSAAHDWRRRGGGNDHLLVPALLVAGVLVLRGQVVVEKADDPRVVFFKEAAKPLKGSVAVVTGVIRHVCVSPIPKVAVIKTGHEGRTCRGMLGRAPARG
jgi:hypothetical protein